MLLVSYSFYPNYRSTYNDAEAAWKTNAFVKNIQIWDCNFLHKNLYFLIYRRIDF